MSKCRCGHEQGQHIYDEGLCRPGFICDCKSFSPAEPKCAECGHEAKDHDNGKDCLWDTVEKAGGPLVICKCQRYRVSEPDATDDNFKIEPISQHTLKVPVQYKGQAEPLDFTEPDATERARAYENSALYEFERYLHENGQALRIPDSIPGSVMVAAEKFAEHYADKQIQIQTPRIKADAVREFVGKLTNKIDRSFVSGVPRKAFAKGTEVYQGYNNGLSTVLYILEKEFPEIAKEITEVD